MGDSSWNGSQGLLELRCGWGIGMKKRIARDEAGRYQTGRKQG